MTTVIPKAKPSKVQMRKQLQREQQKHGKADGHVWANSTAPTIVRDFLSYMGWWISDGTRNPWEHCPRYLRDLKGKMESEGHDYTIAFAREVAIEFQGFERAAKYARHHEGVEDGKRWLATFSTPEQIAHLETFIKDPVNRDFLLDASSPDDFDWTLGHQLAAAILGDAYPTESDSEGSYARNCEEFRHFWQPFLPQPIDDVMADLSHANCIGRYKIQDSDYVIGFIDGALGLSDQIRRRLDMAAQVRSTTDDRLGDFRG